MSMNASEIAANLKSKRGGQKQGSQLNASKVMETGVAEVGNSNDTTDGALNSPNEAGGSSGHKAGEGGMYTGAQLKEKFGLSGGGKGKGLGTHNAALGRGYMSAGDLDRLKSNKEIEKIYVDMRGESQADEHRNDDGTFELGEGSLDALFDDMTIEEKETGEGDTAPKPPTQLSNRAAEAEAFTEAYSGFEDSGGLSQSISGYNPVSGEYGFKNSAGTTPAAQFQENYKMNLKKYLQPGYTRSGHPDPAVSDKPGSPAPENEVQGADYQGGKQYQQK